MAADPEVIKKNIERYVTAVGAGDVDSVMALYAPDAVVEDPINSPPYEGTEAIRGFYAGVSGGGAKLTTSFTTDINVNGNVAAFGFKIHIEAGDNAFEISPIDVMTFADDGTITTMKAYWDPAAVKQVK